MITGRYPEALTFNNVEVGAQDGRDRGESTKFKIQSCDGANTPTTYQQHIGLGGHCRGFSKVSGEKDLFL